MRSALLVVTGIAGLLVAWNLFLLVWALIDRDLKARNTALRALALLLAGWFTHAAAITVGGWAVALSSSVAFYLGWDAGLKTAAEGREGVPP